MMTKTGLGPVSDHFPHFVVLAIASTCLLLPVRVSTTVVVINADDSTNDTMDDSPASFGMSLVDLTMLGAVYESDPGNMGCIPETIPKAPLDPPYNDSRMNWFIVLQRGNCTFAQKALNAQSAGFDAVIVRNEVNRPDRSSLICGAPFPCDNITIYVTMVSNSDGRDLATLFSYSKNFTVSINGSASDSYLYYVLPFIIVVGVVLLVVTAFFVFRFIRDCQIARKARLSRWDLRKIPTRKYKKGVDHYDCCSICLDDFIDGEKLRILPCDHAYHMKCIDPWLLNNRRNCPVCKRKVRVPGAVESDDEESNGNDRATTPSSGAANVGINADGSQPVNHNQAMAIGEGRQHTLSQTSSDGAPLIRRGSGGGGVVCCIPRSYHSTDSLSSPSVAVTGASLPATMPGTSQLSSGIGVATPGTSATTAPTAASQAISTSMVEHHHPVHTQEHSNAACSSEDDSRSSQTDTSSVSGTEQSYVEEANTSSGNEPAPQPASEDDVVVQIVGNTVSNTSDHLASDQDPGAV